MQCSTKNAPKTALSDNNKSRVCLNFETATGRALELERATREHFRQNKELLSSEGARAREFFKKSERRGGHRKREETFYSGCSVIERFSVLKFILEKVQVRILKEVTWKTWKTM